MEAKELKGKTPAELNDLLVDLKKEQFSLRMQRGTGQSNRNHLFGQIKKDIARIKTVLNQSGSGE
jgi:large subunit ribosomal protein L29